MAHNHGKLNKPFSVALFIISLPFVAVGLLVFGLFYVITTVIPAPVEILIYKSSQFYKDLGVKYSLGITSNFGYKSYKYVKKNPCLQMVFGEEGYYYYKTENSVLVIPYYPGYYYENGKWMITLDEGKSTGELSGVKAVFEPLIKESLEGKEVKLLVKERFFKKSELDLARKEPAFVFYKSHKDFDSIMA